MAYNGVSLNGIYPNGFDWTFALADGITEASVNLAVSQDTTAANTVKLAGDGDSIVGLLLNVEDRGAQMGGKTGAVKTKGGMKFQAISSHGLAVGDHIVGGGSGLVKKDASAASNAVVWEVDGDYVIAVLS